MKAIEFVDILKNSFDTVEFRTAEEFNVVLAQTPLPCVLVIPSFAYPVRYQGFSFIESEMVTIAYLDKSEFDDTTESNYTKVMAGLKLILSAIEPYNSLISNIQASSEINKFDDGVIFSAISFDLSNTVNTCKQ